VKRITDREFVYIRSTDTDVRKTFQRIRAQQEQDKERAKCVSNLNEAIERRKAKK
jgi:hypothetical protein